MFLSPTLRFLVEALQVRVQLIAIDAPYAPAADLDRWKIARANERVHLGHADAEIGRDVLQGQKARFEPGRRRPGTPLRTLFRGHARTIAPGDREYLDLASFASVYSV